VDGPVQRRALFLQLGAMTEHGGCTVYAESTGRTSHRGHICWRACERLRVRAQSRLSYPHCGSGHGCDDADDATWKRYWLVSRMCASLTNEDSMWSVRSGVCGGSGSSSCTLSPVTLKV
jgi:hypothetical protein